MSRSQQQIRSGAQRIVETLQSKGYTAYFAGGCVRDMILGRTPLDYDIATSAIPEQVQALFSKTKPIGKAFGVMLVRDKDRQYEVATFREDCSYSDGRRPDDIVFSNEQADALRRDFTVNAIFYDPVKDKLIDYVDGLDDIQNGIIRAVGTPALRFQEDHLRMLRAIRFQTVLGFIMTDETAAAIQADAHLIANISVERIQDELSRMLLEPDQPGMALEQLENLSLLEYIIPEAKPKNAEGKNDDNYFNGSKFMLNRVALRTLPLAFSIILRGNTNIPETNAKIAESALRRLRYSNNIINETLYCIRNQEIPTLGITLQESERRIIVGSPYFPTLLELHRLICTFQDISLDSYDYLNEYYCQFSHPTVMPTPWISGDDLLAKGIQAGPRIKMLLKKAYTAQLNESHKSKKDLLAWILSNKED